MGANDMFSHCSPAITDNGWFGFTNGPDDSTLNFMQVATH